MGRISKESRSVTFKDYTLEVRLIDVSGLLTEDEVTARVRAALVRDMGADVDVQLLEVQG